MDIFSAVRRGDFTRVIYLVEERAVSLQARDQWDATPLYYASFVGNLEMIEYLLAKGARCEEKTFDGERCLYAALNAGVRRVLLHKGFKRAGARRHDLYLEFLEKLYNSPDAFCDIEFGLDDKQITAHRFVLAWRCPMLGKVIQERWAGQRCISDLGRLDPSSLKALIKWCYTCRLEVPISASRTCQQLLQALKLQELAQELAEDDTDLTGDEGAVAVLEPEREVAKIELQGALDSLAEEVCSSSEQCKALLWPDIVLQAGTAKFWSHRAILCGRSEVFAVMLGNSHFKEGQISANHGQGRSGLQLIDLKDTQAGVLQTSLRWMYSDRIDADLPTERLLEVMHFADQHLCEGLKQKCAVLLQPHVTPTSALHLLREAMAMDAERLADACLRLIAQELLELIQEPMFAELVRESAHRVRNREDVDSIPMVDDLRYHVAQLYGSTDVSGDEDSDCDSEGNIVCNEDPGDMELWSERKRRLFALQELLLHLGIEA